MWSRRSSDSDVRHRLRAARLAEWEARIAERLVAAAGEQPDGSAPRPLYRDLAAAIVGMFDAGARDAEVAKFLRRAATDVPALGRLSDEQVASLAAELHRAAGPRLTGGD